MIVGNIRDRERYEGLGEKFRLALEYFATVGEEELQKGDIVLSDGETLVKVRPIVTRPAEECPFEAHERYADIHFVAYGRERIGYARTENMTKTGYSEEKDTLHLTGEGVFVPLEKGDFMIVFPEDAHQPCVWDGVPCRVGKMIAKIKL